MTRCLDICWGWLRGTTLKTMRVLYCGMRQLGYGLEQKIKEGKLPQELADISYRDEHKNTA